MKKIIYDPTLSTEKVMPEFYNFLKTFPTAECERGFSAMNTICTDLRSRLTTNNIANLMFITINGPPLNSWNPDSYVKSWLAKHRSADDTRSKHSKPTSIDEVQKKSLWQIL